VILLTAGILICPRAPEAGPDKQQHATVLLPRTLDEILLR